MTDNLHETAKILSGYVYQNGNFKLPAGAKKISERKNLGNGFYSQAFLIDGHIIIVFRGTDLDKGKKEITKDTFNDIQMLLCKPLQYSNAQKFYYDIASQKKIQEL